jgi:hypothetical protein
VNKNWLLLGLVFTFISTYLQAEPATVSRVSPVRAKPLLDATLITTLAEGTGVELISNEGGWSKIKTPDGKAGYMRLLNLRLTNAGSQSLASGVGKLGNVIRTGSTGAIATTGVKGITKEDLAKAAPRPDEVAKMESYATTAEEARIAAKSVKLSEQSVAFMEAQP